MSNDLMLGEFKGVYRAPHPAGYRDQNIVMPFHVKVKMKREFLSAPGLCGLFKNHYEHALRAKYSEMLELYRFEFMGATELDGKPINNPKAMYHKELIKYIAEKRYPINMSLYNQTELRNEVNLYEHDPQGQQFLQGKLEYMHGGTIALTNELAQIEDLVQVVETEKSKSQLKSKQFAESMA